MKHRLPANLEDFSIHDLRKIARHVGTNAQGSMLRDHLIELLAEESPSLLAPAMDKVMMSGTLGQPDPEVEAALGIGDAAKSSAVDSADVSELKLLVKATQEGVARFAEDVDARVERIEQLASRLLEHEPLRIVVEQRSANAAEAPKVLFAGTAHREFPTLLTMAQAKVNILMVGPAGSGKTTAAEQLSRALGIPFRFNGAIDT